MEWPCRPPESIEEANAQARLFQRMCNGAKIVLYPSQWAAMESAGLDMSNFQLAGPIPTLQGRPLLQDVDA